MSSTRTPPSARRASPASSARPWIVVGAIAVVVLLALAVALVAGSGGDDDDSATATSATDGATDEGGAAGDAATGIAVSGEPLAPLSDTGDDPAVGERLPTLSGTTLDGEQLTVPAAGRPTIVLYVAHWCPHCQAEVPVVQDWVDGGGLPSAVDLVTVSTAVDPRRPNHPPDEWLAREGWTAPVLTDGPDLAASNAAGLTAFPFFVAVDGEGLVVERASGELAPGDLDDLAAGLAGGAS